MSFGYHHGLGYALSYTGADHCHSTFDRDYEQEPSMGGVRNLGVLEPMSATWLGPAMEDI